MRLKATMNFKRCCQLLRLYSAYLRCLNKLHKCASPPPSIPRKKEKKVNMNVCPQIVFEIQPPCSHDSNCRDTHLTKNEEMLQQRICDACQTSTRTRQAIIISEVSTRAMIRVGNILTICLEHCLNTKLELVSY
jgi:hypothetical protein